MGLSLSGDRRRPGGPKHITTLLSKSLKDIIKNIPNGKATFMSQAIDISVTDRFVNHFLHFFKYQLHFYLVFPNLFSNWFTNTTNKHIIIVMEIVHLKFSAEDCQIACMHRTSVTYIRNS